MNRLRAVVLYTTGHLGSAILFNRLVESPEFEVVGLVRAAAVPFRRDFVRRLKKHLKKVGWRFAWLLFWQRVVQGVGWGLGSLAPGRLVRPGFRIASERGIPVHRCGSVNDAACREFLAERRPDVLVSAYFTQILRTEAIAIPRLGTLNVHPGWLPAYRGAMCYFWVLKNGEERAGVSVHWIDQGIDTGALLARRSFRIAPGATQERILVFTAVVGSRLLRRVARRLLAGESPAPIETAGEAARYHPMPGEADFEAYSRRRRFFRIRDVLGQLVRRLRRRR